MSGSCRLRPPPHFFENPLRISFCENSNNWTQASRSSLFIRAGAPVPPPEIKRGPSHTFLDRCSSNVPFGRMVRHKLDSVNDFSRRGYNLRITCKRCSRVVEANAVEMMLELNQRRAPLSILTIEERAKCRECGHRGATITACETNF